MPYRPGRGRETNALSSMIQKIEVEVKKVRYVGPECDNNAICCKYKQFGRGGENDENIKLPGW